MSERDFYREVLTALGEMKAEQAETTAEVKNIVARLDKLNGTVARHEERMNEIQIEVAERRHQCPIAEGLEKRIRPVEDFVTGESAARKTSSAWLKWMWPLIWAGAGAVAVLILRHGELILQSK
jgi:anti-sigma-K factor RskA